MLVVVKLRTDPGDSFVTASKNLFRSIGDFGSPLLSGPPCFVFPCFQHLSPVGKFSDPQVGKNIGHNEMFDADGRRRLDDRVQFRMQRHLDRPAGFLLPKANAVTDDIGRAELAPV